MTETLPTRQDAAGRATSAHGLSWLGIAAPVGGVGFTVLYTVLGAVRPGYDQVRQEISALGTGSEGIWLNVGFVLSGLLIIAGMIGFGHSIRTRVRPVRRAAITALLAVPGAGLVVCGFFHMDTNLLVHTIGAQIACGLPILTLPITAALLWRAPVRRLIAIWLLVAAGLTLIALLGYMFLSATSPSDFSTIAGGGTVGLWERILAVVLYVLCYPSLGIIAFVSERPAPRTRTSQDEAVAPR